MGLAIVVALSMWAAWKLPVIAPGNRAENGDSSPTAHTQSAVPSGLNKDEDATAPATHARVDALLASLRNHVSKLREGTGAKIEDVIPYLVDLHALTLDPQERARSLEAIGAVASSPQEDPGVRGMAVFLLGGFPDGQSRRTLRAITRDPNDALAFWALLSLNLVPIDERSPDQALDEAVTQIMGGVDPANLPGFNHRLAPVFWEVALVEIAGEGLDPAYPVRLQTKYYNPLRMWFSDEERFANSAFFDIHEVGDEELMQDAVFYLADSGRWSDRRLEALNMVVDPGRLHPLVASTLANLAVNPDEASSVRFRAMFELGGDDEFRSTQGIGFGEGVLESELTRAEPRLKVLEGAFAYIDVIGVEWLFDPKIKKHWDRYWEMLLATPGTGEDITNRMVDLAAFEDNFEAQAELVEHTRRDDRWDVQSRAISAMRAAPRSESTLRARFDHLVECARERPLRAAALAVRVLAGHVDRLRRDEQLVRAAIDSVRDAAGELQRRVEGPDSPEAGKAREAVSEAAEAIRRAESGPGE